jgi:DNA-binding response OmpR family regulator
VGFFLIIMNKNILVADDDAAVRDSLKKLLEGAGYQVICAADGDQAEASVAKDPVDLLILDLNLPKQDGWNVFGMANALRPLLPIVILTGLREQAENSRLPGVAALLEKPVDVQVLLNVVSRLLAEPAEHRLRRITSHLRKDRRPQFV